MTRQLMIVLVVIAMGCETSCSRRQQASITLNNGHTVSEKMTDPEIARAFDIDPDIATRKSVQGKDGTSAVYESNDESLTITRPIVTGTSISAHGRINGDWHIPATAPR